MSRVENYRWIVGQGVCGTEWNISCENIHHYVTTTFSQDQLSLWIYSKKRVCYEHYTPLENFQPSTWYPEQINGHLSHSKREVSHCDFRKLRFELRPTFCAVNTILTSCLRLTILFNAHLLTYSLVIVARMSLMSSVSLSKSQNH